MNELPMANKIMTENIRSVPIGSMVVSDNPDDVLVAYGLGSCVAICFYDPAVGVGGMLHALLPSLPNGRQDLENPAKFVDRGVPLLVEALQEFNAKPNRLVTQLCGGAQLLIIPGEDGLSIGERNVQAAEEALRAAGFRIQARATGGNSGRTVRFYIASGRVTVRTLGQEEQSLNAVETFE